MEVNFDKVDLKEDKAVVFVVVAVVVVVWQADKFAEAEVVLVEHRLEMMIEVDFC